MENYNQQNKKYIEDCSSVIINTIQELLRNKEINHQQYIKLAKNITYIISKYAVYHENGISIPAKVLINNFLE